jgi:uncharacterized protein (DUF885 family)
MPRRRRRFPFARFAVIVYVLGALVAATPAPAQPPAAGAVAKAPPDWVAKSNQNAQVLLELFARFAPENAGRMGVPGLDEQIMDLKPGMVERARAAVTEAVTKLEQARATETNPAVRQDLDIMIDQARMHLEGQELNEKTMLPYFDVHGTVFGGIRALLDEQVPEARRPAALKRLQRYAGLEKGYEPITKLAQDRMREKLADAKLLGPVRAEVERDLGNAATMTDGIAKLFEQYKLKGWQKPYAELEKQLDEHEKFVRAEILPRARDDFRQPPELYAYGLKGYGVDMQVEELVARAQVSFREIQNEMQAIAPMVAKQHGLGQTDYRSVIRELKKKQIVGEAILPHYEARIKDLERIIREQKIVSLPERPMQIRLASEAESAQIPAPNMRPPRMIGNTGEKGTFVLPLKMPGTQGTLAFDDFTFEAASWTLTAHEGRPGHELQFAAVVEGGVSVARALFAMNSVNVEGWALYAEAEAKPFEPIDGQLIALQHRLLRAARAYLDPGLQSGTVTKEQAMAVLQEDVVLSTAMATQEVERYTFRSPGQATSYFVGYQRLMELRAETERALHGRFDRQRYHDFILAQGMLPPNLLRQAVREQFVPGELKSAGK